MPKKKSRIIYKVREIARHPYGKVIAGKQGNVFGIQCDYYKVGLVTPPIFKRRSEGIILEEIVEASIRFPLTEFEKEVVERNRDVMCYDNQFPSMPKEGDIDVHPDREYKEWWERFISHYDYLKGMPKGKWLFSFEAPVPEDGFLAERFAEEFEKSLNQSVRFKTMVKNWRKNKSQ